ncbi:MAG TPA: Na+/H+ antiporter NhaA [Sphingobium sp.]|uniref:Na+/H+ antiporter NhaA n=1 Tax=unclassified Sphingobium TaxID=2611147 RepID=UPI0007F3A197|nr:MULTISPECIES: Na+/H+ antiporter NhaA [unclassified Sphingobium]OAN54335.1 Na(+)/H(+) antiporter NhaA [Sphingobium sp. TCM1]WIW88997.1 Na+/H+ antiporter NhaA [Sphingobium sp. V4]HAF40263.1 Na+/H+ antiporter NhaA [Sphingobium sp.]
MSGRPQSALRDFLTGETGGAVLLILAAAAALLLANLPGPSGHFYHDLIHAELGPTLSPKLGPMTVHLWINDGLMAIFFLVVGLEIKREFLDGGLSTWDRRRLPIVAAVAGMAGPALIYLALTMARPQLVNGWAIPAATDIAFAIGVLALLGSRVPASLKLFLTAVAIVDDMGAVAIIALFYTKGLDLAALAGAAGILAALYCLNRAGVRSLAPYLLGFACLWYLTLLSGVHATVAGVLAAMTVPIRCTPGAPDAPDSPLHRLEHAVHPWSAYAIIPLFGFVNSGLALNREMLVALTTPLPLGVGLGLFLGKQFGVFGAIWVSTRLGIAERPAGASWGQVYGMAVLCGIGFTMSLFIGALAFPDDPLLVEEAKGGVLMGSLLSALAGFAILRWIAPVARRAVQNPD